MQYPEHIPEIVKGRTSRIKLGREHKKLLYGLYGHNDSKIYGQSHKKSENS